MSRAACTSVAICASWNWIPWSSAIGLPNASRSFAYATAASSAPCVQRLDRDLVPLPHLAEDVLLRHLAPVEQELGRRRGPDPELVLLLPHREAGEVALDEERGDPAVAGGRVDGREHDVDAGLG